MAVRRPTLLPVELAASAGAAAIVRALGVIKQACAVANKDRGKLDAKLGAPGVFRSVKFTRLPKA